MFAPVARAHPYFLRELGSGLIGVSVTSNARSLALGHFRAEYRKELEPAFTREPHPRGEPEILAPKPDLFVTDPKFWPAVAETLAENIHTDPFYADLVAGETKTPFFHIYDMRLPPVFGRIPEVEDILGTVQLRETSDNSSEIVPGSFEANAMYRVLTQYGATLLSPRMADLLARVRR